MSAAPKPSLTLLWSDHRDERLALPAQVIGEEVALPSGIEMPAYRPDKVAQALVERPARARAFSACATAASCLDLRATRRIAARSRGLTSPSRTRSYARRRGKRAKSSRSGTESRPWEARDILRDADADQRWLSGEHPPCMGSPGRGAPRTTDLLADWITQRAGHPADVPGTRNQRPIYSAQASQSLRGFRAEQGPRSENQQTFFWPSYLREWPLYALFL